MLGCFSVNEHKAVHGWKIPIGEINLTGISSINMNLLIMLFSFGKLSPIALYSKVITSRLGLLL
jgi:hypothetical protein